MKRLIYNIKRFTYSLKVRWRIRKTPKFMRKFAFWWHMAAYDTAQVLKGIRPMAKDTLDSMADLVGIERQEGETDEKLRKRIIEAVFRVVQTGLQGVLEERLKGKEEWPDDD